MGETDNRYPGAEMARLMQIGIEPIKSDVTEKHAYMVRNEPFIIHKKYDIQSVIGMGAYGLVVSAINSETQQKVAVKKVSNLFESLGDAKRILREVRLMRVLKHDKILNIVDMEVPESPDEFNELYMISPLFDKDLEFVLSSGVALEESHVQFFMHQMLSAMKYMHSARVLHRDLKPGNILLLENCDIVVCDLGLARYVDASFEDEKKNEMTEYVVTRWYRAPELVLCPDYTTAVDMWALGCILGEILGREPIFQGKDFKNQIEVITKILGKPYGSETRHIKSPAARKFLEDLPPTKGVPFQKMFPEASAEAIDLLAKMLKFAPHERITAEKALEHPFLKKYHRPKREPSAPADMDYSMLEPQSKSGEDFTAEELRTLLLKEVSHFRRSDPLFTTRPELVGQ